MTPAIGAILSAYAYNSIQANIDGSYVNQYSIPALFQVACAGLCTMLLLIAFVDTHREALSCISTQHTAEQEGNVINNSNETNNTKGPDDEESHLIDNKVAQHSSAVQHTL